MTKPLFRDDAYLRACTAQVVSADANGIVLDRTVFYPRGGGQPGDAGVLRGTGDAETRIVDTIKGEDDAIVHLPQDGAALPEPGAEVEAVIDWDRRYRHMRMHTCLHLVGAVLQYPVTGGNISAEKSRLDFDMPDPPDKEAANQQLAALIAADHPVQSRWISETELDAQPELVRTMSVSPPRGAGQVRLLEIPGVDLQPCGGTHVAHTAEIGAARIAKIEKKGRQNRRVSIVLDD